MYIYLRRRCKWWRSGWHWKDNCQKLVQNIITLHEIDESLKKNYFDLKFIMHSRYMKKKFKFKIIYSQLLLRITFDDRLWSSYIDILYLSTWLTNRGHHEKLSILINIFILFIGIWPRKPRLLYTGALVWSTLLCLHSPVRAHFHWSNPCERREAFHDRTTTTKHIGNA